VRDAPIYLDYAATTPVAPEVLDAMVAQLKDRDVFANASSTHVMGRATAERVEQARAQLASLLSVAPGTLVWTSGATEANNLAILGAARAARHRGRHLVTSLSEHKAVVDPFRQLEREGFDVTWLTPDADGVVSSEEVEAAIRDDTLLVSIMHVNNEIGVIQDIQGIGGICRQRGVLFHTDAAQSVGKLPLDVTGSPIDFLSLSAHKFCGPQGIGALYIADRPESVLLANTFGGSQERRLRPGTLPVHLIVGCGEAARLAADAMDENRDHVMRCRDRFWDGIRNIDGLIRNGSASQVWPGILNVSISGVDGESLLLELAPVCVAKGSACTATSGDPSHVLIALGRDELLARSAIRVSFAAPTTIAEVDIAVERYRAAVERLRGLAPDSATMSK